MSDRDKAAFQIAALACLWLLAAGAIARFADLAGVSVRSPDEWTYSAQAAALLNRGPAALSEIAARYSADPAMFAHPSPVRAAFLGALAAMQAVTRDSSPYAGAVLSCLSSIGVLALAGWLGLEIGATPLAAVLAMLFLVASPLELAMARRAWGDSFLELWGMALILVSIRAARGGPWPWAAAAGALAGLSLAIKELAMLESALLCALLALSLFIGRQRTALYALIGTLVVVGALVLAGLAAITGGIVEYLRFLSANFAHLSTDYAIAYQSGAPGEWLGAFWSSDPLLASFGLAGMAIVLARFARRPRIDDFGVWLALIALCFLSAPLFTSNKMNYRFICLALGPLAILSAVAAVEVERRLERWVRDEEARRWVAGLALVALLVAVQINFHLFQRRFVATDLQDLSLRMIWPR